MTMLQMARPWYDSPWKIAGRALSMAVGIVLLAATVVLFVVPQVMGGAALTVLTGSMAPAFSPGDVIVVRGIAESDVCRDVGVGDIVSYFPHPANPDLITHRVIGKTVGTFPDGTTCRLILQGDANSAVDAPVSPAQVRGVFLYGVPYLGWARQWMQQNPAILVAAIAGVLLFYFLWDWIRPAKKTRVVIASNGMMGGGALSGPGFSTGAEPVPPGPMISPATTPVDLETYRMELELRRRELAVREREVAVREEELSRLLPGPDTPPPGIRHPQEAEHGNRSSSGLPLL